MWTRLNRLLSTLEWRWSLGLLLWGAATSGSFVLPAWATRASGVLSQFAPLSWVAAGFAGLFVFSGSMAIYGYARGEIVRARYDEKFMAATGGVDPLARVFEGKRIYLNDFVLPSNPTVNGKTFVDCEIVGPTNVFLEVGNSINDVRPAYVDAVALSDGSRFFNGVSFQHCSFRNCTFHRVTLFFTASEALKNSDLNWLNWISPFSTQLQMDETEEPSQIEDQSPTLCEDSE